MDRLYRSETAFYRALDGVRGRVGRGRRVIAEPPGTNLSIDPSVFERMAADPKAVRENGRLKYPELLQVYRPRNVLQFLACLPDLDGYLRQMEEKAREEERERRVAGSRRPPADRTLPPDVRQELERLRPSCGSAPVAAGAPP